MQVLFLIADSPPLVGEDDAFMQIIEMILLLYLALMTHVCVPNSSSLPIFALLNQYYAPDSDGIV